MKFCTLFRWYKSLDSIMAKDGKINITLREDKNLSCEYELLMILFTD